MTDVDRLDLLARIGICFKIGAEGSFGVATTTNFPSLEPLVCEKLNYISCTTEEILKHLKSLKTNKSPGPDRISPVILKSCAFELAPSISFLVYKSFLLGHLPEDWRSADIVPLHKKGSKQLRENYRPISLTSMICKISEKLYAIG